MANRIILWLLEYLILEGPAQEVPYSCPPCSENHYYAQIQVYISYQKWVQRILDFERSNLPDSHPVQSVAMKTLDARVTQLVFPAFTFLLPPLSSWKATDLH
uniref:Uncharacterized protein n=1 Tax=Compsopogon caeruleus TaxID=31354 RepID=A0A7S1XBK2_9RHOD